MKVILRELLPTDARAIKEIELLSGLSSWSEEDYARESTRSDTLSYVAAHDGFTVGFLVGRIIGDSCELFNVAVRPESRRKGVGDALINRLVSAVSKRGLQKIFLEVRIGNSSGLAFYMRHAFEEYAVRKNFYANPTEDAILMQKIVK